MTIFTSVFGSVVSGGLLSRRDILSGQLEVVNLLENLSSEWDKRNKPAWFSK